MFGTITAIGDDWVELEVAKRHRVRYLKRAISSITTIDQHDEEDEDEYIEPEDYEEVEYEDAETVEDEDATDVDEIEDAEQEEIVEEATDRDPARARRPGGSQGVTTPASALTSMQRVTTSPADAAGPVTCRDSCLRPELRSDVDSTQG